MSHKMKKLKSGHRSISFTISNGRDPVTGKQQIVTRTWKVPDTWSDKKAEREATRMEAEFRVQLAEGNLTTKHEGSEALREEARKKLSQPTFREYTDRFIEKVKNDLEMTTVYQYQNVLLRANDYFGDIKMADIDRFMLDDYISKKQKEGIKYNTLIFYQMILLILFKAAYEDGVIQDIPIIKQIKRSKKEQVKSDESKSFNECEAHYILQCADKESPRNRALIYLLLDSGIRRNEALALRWDHINFDTGVVLIDSSLQYIPKYGYHISTPKNGKFRKLILSNVCLSVMDNLKKNMIERHTKDKTQMGEYCFESTRSNLLSPSTVNHIFEKFGKKYNILDFHPHKLRHTMISISLSNGADPMIVSKKAGHSSLDITYKVYSHAIEEGQRKASDALASAIYGQNSR